MELYLHSLMRIHGVLLNYRVNFTLHLHHGRSRDSAVGIATGYGLDDRGSQFESQ
jgi:hypothetical protein